jgi:Ser/Thr protein kinase RdoA (MazF antagonist)
MLAAVLAALQWMLTSTLGKAFSIAALVVILGMGAWAYIAYHDAEIRKEALKGYVTQARLDEATAKNMEMARQLRAGRLAAEQYAKLLAEAQEKERVSDAETEQKIANYEQKLADHHCRLNQSDLDFLR